MGSKSTMMFVVMGLLVTAALGGCAGPERVKGPDYTPIRDEQLFAKIGEVRGVTNVDIKYVDSLDFGQGYVGGIRIESGADPVAVLDQGIAILRQGRWRASMTLEALQPERTTSTDALGIGGGGEPFLTERYGPQPGNGLPPESTPTPTSSPSPSPSP